MKPFASTIRSSICMKKKRRREMHINLPGLIEIGLSPHASDKKKYG